MREKDWFCQFLFLSREKSQLENVPKSGARRVIIPPLCRCVVVVVVVVVVVDVVDVVKAAKVMGSTFYHKAI